MVRVRGTGGGDGMGSSEPMTIVVDHDVRVSGIATIPSRAASCFVFAHGAGAGMEHPFMAAVADGLARLRIATMRYQFPYMEKHSRRTDPPKLCHQVVRAAVGAAHDLLPKLPLFAGGKSFGGRMTSQTQAASPLPHVRGLGFFGFPLHPPKQPATSRADHLSSIEIPMLFLQGSRDALADLALIQSVAEGLGSCATLKIFQHADHSFHVPARRGGSDSALMQEMLATLADWMKIVAKKSG